MKASLLVAPPGKPTYIRRCLEGFIQDDFIGEAKKKKVASLGFQLSFYSDCEIASCYVVSVCRKHVKLELV
jgi:hypothetical protein